MSSAICAALGWSVLALALAGGCDYRRDLGDSLSAGDDDDGDVESDAGPARNPTTVAQSSGVPMRRNATVRASRSVPAASNIGVSRPVPM